MPYQAVVIGASTGGMNALCVIFSSIETPFPIPIIIAQHLHPNQGEDTFSYLNNRCSLIVKSADDKEVIKPGYVYFAPPNYHLLIEKDQSLSLSIDRKVRYSRPSIDVLFESAADVFSSHLIGIILSGANDDGTNGLQAIRKNHGLTIIQDPSTAEADYMPRSALAAVNDSNILPLDEIGPFLNSQVKTT